MPQIEQLPVIFFSQLFWLLLVFGIIFFGIGRGMLPKIQSTVDAREAKIAADLAAAEKARETADATEQAWRDKVDSARAEASKVAIEAKDLSARETEVRVRKSAEKIAKKAEAAETRIRDAASAARAEIEAVATEAAQDMVGRLTGLAIDKKDAAAAVKAELHG
ncbi:MAG: ATPase [Sphingomonas sp.]|nr:ATPase [Sphingomonas sp.]